MWTKSKLYYLNLLAFALVVATLISAPEPVLAQQEEGASSILEEITVTARRREESLQDTPIALSAFNADMMRSMGVTNSRDIARFTPNLQSISQGGLGGNFQDNISIRGLGANREFPDTEQSVGIYIDDVFFPRSAGNVVEVVQLERVEVLRGPQGTLFGRNSMSGTIRYVTRKPSGEFGSDVEATFGSLNRVDVEGSIDFPLSDNWSALVSFGKDTRDGFVTHDADQQTSGSKNISTIRAALRYQSDALTVDIAATDLVNRNDGPPRHIFEAGEKNCATGFSFHCFVANDPGGPYDSRYNSKSNYSIHGNPLNPDFLRLDQSTLQATVTYDISDNLTFKSVTADTTLDYVWSQDLDASPLKVFDASFGEVNDFFQQELQLLGSSDRLDYVVGLFFYNDSPHYNQYTINSLQGERVRDQFYETDASAVYAQGTYDISDRVSLTLGGRYTDEEKAIESIFTQHGSPAVQGLSSSNSESWGAFTGHINLSVRPSDNLMYYGSISEGFKSGGINFNLDTSPMPAPNNGILPFDPEESISYEVGVKWNSANGNILVNTAAFYMDVENQQLGGQVIHPAGFFGIQVNAGRLNTSGLEVDLQAAVTENFMLRATAALLSGEYDDIGAAGVTGLLSAESDLGLTPDSAYSLGGQFTRPLAGGGQLLIDVDYAWRDEMQAQANNQNGRTLDAVGLLNGGLEYIFPDGNFSLSLRGTNMTDEWYFTHYRRGNIDAPFGQSSVDIGRPREWSISASYSF